MPELAKGLQDVSAGSLPQGEPLTLAVSQAITAHPDFETRITAAGQDIKSAMRQENLPPELAEKALSRAVTAITKGISVFISYKSEHEALARTFRTKILEYGQKYLAEDSHNEADVFLSCISIEGGKEFLHTIELALSKAHWFILLLPDVDLERDWPIYEAAYFRRGMAYGERLICVHHKDVQSAPQLAEIQHYESTPAGLEKMFRELFFQSHVIPGMDQIAAGHLESQLKDDATALSSLFQGPQPKLEADFSVGFADVAHSEGMTYNKVSDLLVAPVRRIQGLVDVFNQADDAETSLTFGELIDASPDGKNAPLWASALTEALRAAVEKKPSRPVTVPFLGYTHGTAFRPCLHSTMRRGRKGEIAYFHIIFINDFGQEITNAPLPLDTLETALRLSYRSYWEVFAQFTGRLTGESVDTIRRYTERAEEEARARGVLDQEAMVSLFPNEDDKALVRAWSTRYYTDIRNPETRDGKMDRAFRERDPELMRECLDELRPRTLHFLALASRLYADLLTDEYKRSLATSTTPTLPSDSTSGVAGKV